MRLSMSSTGMRWGLVVLLGVAVNLSPSLSEAATPKKGITALSLSTIAFLHMAGGFALLVFLVVHVYMTTTGHSLTAHFKAMCTGYEEVPVAQKNT